MLWCKLKSKNGASMIFALLFLLVCLTIGGIVLTSAASNAGRLGHMRDGQQAYLTVSSAARVVRNQILSGQYIISETTTIENGLESVEFFNKPVEANALSQQLNAWIHYIQVGESAAFYPSGTDSSFIISAPDQDNIKDVTAKFTMDESYNVNVVLSLDGSMPHTMTLSIDGMAVQSEQTSTDPVLDDDGDIIGERITTTRTTAISWNNPVITKGGASHD